MKALHGWLSALLLLGVGAIAGCADDDAAVEEDVGVTELSPRGEEVPDPDVSVEAPRPPLPLERSERNLAAAPDDANALTAVAEVQPIGENETSGSLLLTQTPQGVEITGRLMNLPTGKHGFHVHASETCEDPGDHFAPAGNPHGDPKQPVHHAGDLGNIVSGPDNEALLYVRSDDVTLEEGERSILGKTLVVHAGADDLQTQPSGDSGDPIACAVIEPGATEMAAMEADAGDESRVSEAGENEADGTNDEAPE